jgi:hypothetical protein
LTVAFRPRDGFGRLAACVGFALAVVLALAGHPVQAQQPAGAGSAVLPPPYPAGTAELPPPPPPAPAPGWVGDHEDGVYAPEVHWGWYVETGPVFPMSGTLEHNLDAGWTVQGGVRESIGEPNNFVFGEFAGEYWTFDTKTVIKETAVNAFFPDTAIRTINNFYLTHLTDFQQYGIHGAVGWTFYPEYLNGSTNDPGQARRVFLTTRGGFRIGAMNAAYEKDATPAGLAVLKGFNAQHGNVSNSPARVRLVDPVETSEPYFGPFATLGMGVTWKDISLGKVYLGNVSLAGEVELAYEATDLGTYLHEADLFSISPRITVSFSY